VKHSTQRILCTHTGSLPRPADLRDALVRIDQGDPPDAETFAVQVQAAVADVVARQVAAGLDIVNDGEMSKVSYSTYVTERLSGFGGAGRSVAPPDIQDFPEWALGLGMGDVSDTIAVPACVDDVTYANRAPLDTDLAHLRAAVRTSAPHDVFMSAASPGVVSLFLENQHYASHDDYLHALAAAMKVEYDAIHQAGFVLQIDCPDLAMGRHIQVPGASLEEWRRTLLLHVDALNEATCDIPPADMRIHLCWGNYEGPHHLDVPLGDILDIVFRARPAGIAFEAANPRHEHEWQVFEDVALPDGKVLIPGVIDTTTSYVEHPELVAQRILRFARVVGRERVIAGTDCGFASAAAMAPIDPKITFAKLRAMADGAERASGELWDGRPAHTPVTLPR